VVYLPDKLILSFDIGTSYIKTSLVDTKFNILATELDKYPIYFPKKGYVEQDPLDWWNAVVKTTKRLVQEKSVDASKIVGITFGGQALCTVPINKDGEPLMRAISWMDARAAEQAKKVAGGGLLKIGGYNLFSILTFLRITGGGPGLAGKDHLPRILWLRENMPDVLRDTYKFVDTNGFIIFKMTGQTVMSKFDAHITWMMDTRPGKHCWSDKILKRYGVDKEKLPEIKASTDVAGKLTKKAADELSLKEGTPVIVGSGDVAAVAVGSAAVKEREYFIYIGTSDFMGTHTKHRKVDISHYMGSICSAIPDMYLYTGEQETAGTCLDWVKNEVYKSSAEELGEKVYDLLDEAAGKIPAGSEGLMFTPWLSGEKTPMDDDTIRGGFHNLSLEHNRDHMVRAVMEGVAFNIRWAFRCMEKKIGTANWVNFVGGGALRETWGQIIADVLNREVRQLINPREVGVRGAAMIATVGLGIHKDFPTAAKLVKVTKVYKPKPENVTTYDKLFAQFEKLYECHKKICKYINEKIHK